MRIRDTSIVEYSQSLREIFEETGFTPQRLAEELMNCLNNIKNASIREDKKYFLLLKLFDIIFKVRGDYIETKYYKHSILQRNINLNLSDLDTGRITEIQQLLIQSLNESTTTDK
jgi:8-oxo-dGTP pyrophosphatase MutT (NUDIX family)